MSPRLTSFNTLIQQYDAFLIDLWGVVHDGLSLYPGVSGCLTSLLSQEKSILFLSNAPRPGKILLNKLKELGLPIQEDMILSSGDIVRSQFQTFSDAVFQKLGRRFFHLGEHRNQDILADIAVSSNTTLKNSDFILLTAYTDEEEDKAQYDSLLKEALDLNLPMICANPDKIIQNGSKLRYCSGVIAEQYEKMGGTVHYYGKPHPAIYEEALRLLNRKGILKKKVLAIGDTLETDIKGAHAVQLDSALTLTGNLNRLISLEKEHPHSQNSPFELQVFLERLFQETKLSPTWVIPGLFCDKES